MSAPHGGGPGVRAGVLPGAIVVVAAVLFAVYALPLFAPPASTAVADASSLLGRLFPAVPPLWIALRLAALAVIAALLADPRMRWPNAWRRATGAPAPPAAIRRRSALVCALMHASVAPWAVRLGPRGQLLYLAALFVPALLLVRVDRGARRSFARSLRGALPAAALIGVWIVARLITDLGSPRVADAVDGWRGVLDIVVAASRPHNVLTDLFDVDLPGAGSIFFALHGVPLIAAGMLPLSFPLLQTAQILWLAACAAGLGVLARVLLGRGAAPIAIAVFLFAPYTRLVAILPGPFLAGPVYAVALALCAVLACRHRSAAAVAALGPLAAIGATYPGVVPIVAMLLAWTAWSVRRDWRELAVPAATAVASFAAVVVPALGTVLTPGRMVQHFGLHGALEILEPALLGQLPLRAFEMARATQVWRPLEIVGAALVEPFANPRTAIRLWGDVIFDPLGATLIAIGVVTCLFTAARARTPRFLLLLYAATLSPALVSPVDRVDIVHAVALPIPAALLAAAGFAAARQRLGIERRAVGTAATVAAVVAAIGGSVLFDGVNPRILSASAPGIMFRVVAPEAASRVVALAHPQALGIDTRWTFVGVMTAFANAQPVGFLEYGGGSLPTAELAAEGKDLVFWSPGLEQDAAVSAAVCAQAPEAELYEIWDDARRSRVHAARLGPREWQPRVPAARWSRGRCGLGAAAPPQAAPR